MVHKGRKDMVQIRRYVDLNATLENFQKSKAESKNKKKQAPPGQGGQSNANKGQQPTGQPSRPGPFSYGYAGNWLYRITRCTACTSFTRL